MTDAPKYNFPKAEKVQIFEAVDTYIETQHNHPIDPQVQGVIDDLTSLLTQLQSQHPQVQTLAEALPIIDAEFIQIQQSPTHKLATLRQQILDPERHAQAVKATLGEIAKHCFEDSLWAKAVITYVDKMSETPDQGA